MRPKILLTALFLVTAAPTTRAADLWWEYMARYDKGLGVVNVNLSLRKQSPMADYPYLIMTGSTYQTNIVNPLPNDEEKARLKVLEQQELAIIRAAGPAIVVGNFSYAGEHTQYVYAQRTEGVEAGLKKLYARNPCKECISFTTIKKDETWRIYNKFLYPNEQTRVFYKGRLEKLGFKHEEPAPPH